MNLLLDFNVHPSAYIGYSIIFARSVEMEANAKIGHLSFIKGIDSLKLGNSSHVGNLNWITAFPTRTTSKHYAGDHFRKADLHIGDHSSITNRHLIDCTGGVYIGRYSTFAGFRSQILTHSIDLAKSKQCASSVNIGDYCFLGTGAILLAGSDIPNYSVVGAGSVVTKGLKNQYRLYAGAPAREIKALSANLEYFIRSTGYVE